jgi:hypothetical protein
MSYGRNKFYDTGPRGFTLLGSSARVEVMGSFIHISLLSYGINCSSKKFYEAGNRKSYFKVDH